MSIQQKIIQYQGLTDYETHIVDTLPTSKYFKVFSLEDTIPGGRSTFQILGSEFLENGVELKIELLDVNGIPVYTEPIKYLGDDPSRHIMIEVYPTTAIGVGRLTILGSVVDVPDEWKGLYNVKWEKDVFIDQVSKNTQPILFRGQGIDLVRNQRYPLPEIEIFETVTGVVVASGSGGNEFVTSSIFEGGSYDGNASPFARPMHIGDLINARTQESLIDSPPRNMGHAGIGGGQTAKTSYAAKPKNQQNTSDTTAIETNIVEQKYEEFHKPQAEPTPPPTPPIPQVASKPIPTPPPVETKAKQPDAVGKGTLIKRKSGEPFRLELAGGTFKSTPVVSDLVEGIKGREFESSSFTASIVAVHSPDLIEIDTPFVVEDKTPEKDDDPFIPVPHTGSDYTIDFEPVSTGSASEVILQSFANITIKNMKTFSGDVHRVKVFAKGFSTQGDFRLVSDKIVEGTDVLINTGSVSLTQKTGKFIDQQHIDNNWQVKHIKRGTNTVGVVDTQGTATFTSSVHPPLMNAVLVSGSNTLADESILFETTTPKIKLRPNVDYTLYVNAVLKTAGTDVLQDDGSILNNQPKAKVRFYVSGSNLGQDLKGIKPASSGSVGNILGDPIKVITAEDEPQGEVIELKTKGSEIGKTIDFGRVKIPFKPQFTGDGLTINDDTKLQIEVEEGELFIQSVGIEPSSDTNFNPDEFTFQVPMPKLRKRPDFFDFLVEFYDRDGNKAGYTTIKEAVEFDGENDVIQGTDNLLTGSLSIGNALGVGIEAAGVNSAYIRSVDYAGFDSSSVSGRGGFLMFSGSVSRSLNTSESYDGVGLELHDGNSSSFKFRTLNADGVGEFDIRTDKFFFGRDRAVAGAQFVSGSNGNIEISGSNFHLKSDGNLIIGAGATINKSLSANSILVPAGSTIDNAVASIQDTGAARFKSASIGGFNVSETAISSSNGELVLKSNGQITGSNFKLDGGTIGSDVVIDAGVTANSLSLPAVGTPTAVVTAQGEATFSKAEIGSFKIGNQEIKSLSGSLILSASGAITASDILATGNITANAGQVFQDVTNLHATSGALETDISSSISRSIAIEEVTGSLIISQSDIRVSLTSSREEQVLIAKGFGEKAVVSASNFAQGAEATASALAQGAETSASVQVTASFEFTREQTGSLKDFSLGAADSGSKFAKEFSGGAIASASLLGEGAVASASELGAGAILSSSIVLANVTKSFGDSTGSFNTRFNFVGTQTASLILRADDIERTTGSLNAETSSIRTVFDGVGQNTASILLATESLFLSSSEAKSSASFAASGSQVFSKFSSSLVLASASAEFVSSASLISDKVDFASSGSQVKSLGFASESITRADTSSSFAVSRSDAGLASASAEFVSSASLISDKVDFAATGSQVVSLGFASESITRADTSSSFAVSRSDAGLASASAEFVVSGGLINTKVDFASSGSQVVSLGFATESNVRTDAGLAPIRTDFTQSRFEVTTLQSQATQSIRELGTLQTSTTQSLNASSSFAGRFITSASILRTNLDGVEASASSLAGGAIVSASVDATSSISVLNTLTSASIETSASLVSASAVVKAQDITDKGIAPIRTDVTQSRFEVGTLQTQATQSIGELTSLQTEATQSIGELGTLQSSTTKSLDASSSFAGKFITSASILRDNLGGVESSASLLAGGAFVSASTDATSSTLVLNTLTSASIATSGSILTTDRIAMGDAIAGRSASMDSTLTASFGRIGSITSSFLGAIGARSASMDATLTASFGTIGSITSSFLGAIGSRSASMDATISSSITLSSASIDFAGTGSQVRALEFAVNANTSASAQTASLLTDATQSKADVVDVRVGITGSNTLTAQVSHSFGLATASIKTQATSSDVEITASRAVFSGSLALDEVTFVSGGIAGGRGATKTGSLIRPLSDVFALPGGASNPTQDRLSLQADLLIAGTRPSESGETDSFGAFVNSCVLPGTKILIKRENILAQINIEDTKKDDLIYVFDFKTKEFDWSPIKKIMTRETKEGWSHIKTEKGYELKCSNSHLLYHPDYPNNAIKTNELGVGGQLYVFENNKIVEDKINFIQVYDELVEVWNYELEFTHNYISNGILSHNAVTKPFTAGHRYFSSENLEKGDLVKLNENNEIVKTTEQKDTSVLGIVWYEFCLGSFGVDGDAALSSDKDIYKRDSLGKVYTDEEMKTKKLWNIAAIGDTRFVDTNRKKQDLNGLKICNQNGEVKKGDLLCSSDTPGYAMKQPTEFVITSITYNGSENNYEERQNMNSFTIGKSMEDVEFDENGKSEGVYGYLYCG